MLGLLITAGVLGTATLAVVIWRHIHPRAAGAPKDAPLTLFSLSLGDVVAHGGTDYVVEGHLTYNEEQFTWQEYLLAGTNHEVRWLSVEEDDRLEVMLLSEVTELSYRTDPGKVVNWQGRDYKLVESGSATVERLGRSGNRKSSKCRYWDFAAQAPHVLSIECWDGKYEVTAGVLIPPQTLTLLPGADRALPNAL